MSDSNDLQDAGATERAQRLRATRAVTRYLDSLSGRSRPAKTATTRTVETELAKIDEQLAKSALGSARRLKLLQDRRNLLAHGIPARGRSLSKDDLLDSFITHAASYAEDHEISYEAFLDFGVPAEVLDKAHIHPSGGQAETDASPPWPPPPSPRAEPNAQTSIGGGREATHAMRAWLQENGYEVADRGRIPQTMQDAYHRAHD